jgi:glycosyltransferase involved in cell wall biosynthesis
MKDTAQKDTAFLGLERPRFGQFVRQVAQMRTEQLEECLKLQKEIGGKIGRIIQGKGYATEQQVAEAIKMQARWVAQALQADVGPRGFPYPTFFSLCLPAYNEKDNIEDTLDDACAILPEFVEQFEVVVVDDGSRDNTGDIVDRYSERVPQVRLVRHERNKGYGAAVTTALRAARGELVAFTDSDGQFSLLDLPLLLAKIDQHDVVLGYRYNRADSPIRLFNAWGWNWVIRLALGVRIKDLDCAFKVFRRDVLDRLRLTSTGATINAEMMAQCMRGGLRMVELPVNHYPRYAGAPTGAALKVIMRAFRELPALLRYRFDTTPMLARPTQVKSPEGLEVIGRGGNGTGTATATRETAGAVATDDGDTRDDDVLPPSGDGLSPAGQGTALSKMQPAEPDSETAFLNAQKPLRVCMLASCPFPANHGTPGSIREMSEALCAAGHEVHVVTYHYGDDIPIQGPRIHRITPLLKESKIVVGPTIRRPLYDLQLVFKTWSVVREFQPDVIHAHNYEAALAAGMCRYLFGIRTPIVYSGHTTMIDELPSYNFIRPRFLAVWLAKVLDFIVPRLGHRCLPHSKNTEDFFVRQGLAARTDPVVNFGIDTGWAATGDGERVRQTYGLGKSPVILYTGVLDHFQRLDLLLEAMKDVLAREPEARLVIVQTVPGKQFVDLLRAQAERLGIADRLIITEPQSFEKIPDFLAAADVAVVPRPQAQGFPIKLLNYMAAGRACVLFASSASKGIEHGQTVLLAPRDTGEALASEILTLLADAGLRDKLGAQALEFVCQHHDRKRIAANIAECYRRAINPVPVATGTETVAPVPVPTMTEATAESSTEGRPVPDFVR